MAGRVCVVTGGTSGVGRAIARGLARRGATVILPCRDLGRGRAAAREMSETSRNPNIDVMAADLSSRESIRQFADAFSSRYGTLHVLSNNAATFPMHGTLHVLSNNAATFPMHRATSVDGIEMILATNYLGHFLLTNLLLDLLKSGAPSRVLTVSGKPKLVKRGRLHFEDIQLETRFNPVRATLQAALAKAVFSFELARRLEGTGVTSNTFHPGLVRSNLARSFPWCVKPLVGLYEFLFASEECPAGVYLASSTDVEEVTGAYFVEKRTVPFAQESAGKRGGALLWEISERLTGLSS
jgi:NAD(P)-dependent dehydrogenase (short-subunit alcohol dehydrogenase family)